MGTVTQIFLAPARGAPMREQTTVAAIADIGLEGDRYADPRNRREPRHQLTLIESEHIAAFTALAASTGRSFTADLPRRNLVTRGIALNELCGRRFQVGEAILEGLELCEPCRLFAKRTYRDVLPFFLNKGGLRARVIAGGRIRAGDPIVSDLAAPIGGNRGGA